MQENETVSHEKDAAVREKEAISQEKDAALREMERLKSLLLKEGIDPG